VAIYTAKLNAKDMLNGNKETYHGNPKKEEIKGIVAKGKNRRPMINEARLA
jgi:hypothetical protein